jgi:hypothetical protein
VLGLAGILTVVVPIAVTCPASSTVTVGTLKVELKSGVCAVLGELVPAVTSDKACPKVNVSPPLASPEVAPI